MQVIPAGKPGKEIYKSCCKILDEPAQNILAVGDSFEFDVKGYALLNLAFNYYYNYLYICILF